MQHENLISLEKILKRAKTESFASDREPAVSSVFQQKLMVGQHTYIADLWSYERR